MSEYLLVALASEKIPDNVSEAIFNNIDHQSELVTCDGNIACGGDFAGSLEYKQAGRDSAEFERFVAQRFEKLFGRQPVGTVRARVSVQIPSVTLRHKGNLSLIVEDDAETIVVPTEIYWAAGTHLANGESPRFKILYTDGDATSFFMQGWMASTFPGVAHLPSGKTLSIQLERNLGTAPIVLTFIDELEIEGKKMYMRSRLFAPKNIWDW